MIRHTLLILVSVLLISSCSQRQTDCLLNSIQSRKTLRIGIKTDSPPFGFMLGETPAGFDVDIAIALAQQLGVTPRWTSVNSSNRLKKLQTGEIDMVIASTTITRGRESAVDFTIPYFEDGQGLLVPTGSTITSYYDLDDKTVGVVKGSTSAANMAQVAPNATIVSHTDYGALFDALKDGAVDAITSDTLILIGLHRHQADSYQLAGPRFSTEPYGIAVPENQSDLRDAINAGLQRLWENGEYQMIFDTWFGPGTPYNGRVSFTMTPYPH